MKVEFNRFQTWKDFYSRYVSLPAGLARTSEWVNFPCILPSHPKLDTKNHGGVNLVDGRYRCWSGECTAEWRRLLEMPFTSLRETLYPAEFLVLTQNVSRQRADESVESYRLETAVEGVVVEKQHYDNLSKVYQPSPEWGEFVKRAQESLSPDLDIVQEYCQSRGLKYSTLVHAGVGYVPENSDLQQMECLVHPYYISNQVVGVRGRTSDGKKGGVKGAYSVLYGLQLLPKEPPSTVCIAEGETDTLCLRQLLLDNDHGDVPVVGVPGSTWDQSWNRHLQGVKRIVFVSQTDQPSQLLGLKIRQAFPNRAEVVVLPFPQQTWGKDISDFLKLDDQAGLSLVKLLSLEGDVETGPYVRDLSSMRTVAEREIPWLITGVIERGTKILLVGDPKTQKTWLALEMARSLATGEPWLGNPDWSIPDAPLRTLLVEEEGALHRLGQRVSKLFDDVSDPSLLWTVHRQNVKLSDQDSVAALRKAVVDTEPDLIILDPYAAIHGRDENDARDTMGSVETLNNLLRLRPQSSIVLIHHLAKAGSPRGSGALWGAMDGRLNTKKVDGGDILLSMEGREIEDMDPVTVQFDPELGRHTVLRLEAVTNLDESILDRQIAEDLSVFWDERLGSSIPLDELKLEIARRNPDIPRLQIWFAVQRLSSSGFFKIVDGEVVGVEIQS